VEEKMNKSILRQIKVGQTVVLKAKDFVTKVKPKDVVSVQFNVDRQTDMVYEGHINKKIFIFTALE
jgi:hypothetical protein